MKLVSNIDLTYSDGSINGGTDSGIIEGTIIRQEKQNDETIQFLYQYKNADGLEIKTGYFPISEAEADALYSAVEANLPDINTVGYSAWNEALFYEGFRVEMASTFGVTVADIDIVA